MQLDVLNQTILEGLGTLSDFNTVSNMPKRRDAITLPAVLVDLAEIEYQKDPGNGQLDLMSHWEARVISSEKDHESVIWQLVLNVMYWIFDYHWPQINIHRPMLKSAAPDHFMPEFQGHRIWLIEWMHLIRIGDDIYSGGENIETERLVVHWGDECFEELPIE